jgi:hypothetical protein
LLKGDDFNNPTYAREMLSDKELEKALVDIKNLTDKFDAIDPESKKFNQANQTKLNKFKQLIDNAKSLERYEVFVTGFFYSKIVTKGISKIFVNSNKEKLIFKKKENNDFKSQLIKYDSKIEFNIKYKNKTYKFSQIRKIPIKKYSVSLDIENT